MSDGFGEYTSPTGDTSIDPALRAGVEELAQFLRAEPMADDEALERRLIDLGLSEPQAAKLIVFAPIAFTRYLYRAAGVRFAPNYVAMSPDGRPAPERPIAEEPAFQAAWAWCMEAAAQVATDDRFLYVAARSGGWKAIQSILRQGASLEGIITSPPFVPEPAGRPEDVGP